MRVHAVYLAVIAVLVVVLAYAAARAVRAHRLLTDLEARFGGADGRLAPPRAQALRPRPVDLLRPRTWDEYRQEVDEAIDRARASGEFGPPSRLSEACGLALAGGKRLRAIITLEVARAAAASQVAARGRRPIAADAMEAALFIEYVHAAALVVDDLPCFDDDVLRRGGPALHVAVGPAVAQLAALALVAAAYQTICRQVDWIRANCPGLAADRIGMLICSEASRAMGAMGAAGGQYMDISSPDALAEEYAGAGVETITYRKTATFFEIALVAGWLAGGGAAGSQETLREAGRLVGTAFQIADDIGDFEVDAARAAAGKPGWNFAATYGLPVARRELDRHLNGARLLLSQAGLWTPLWQNEIFTRIRGMATPAGQQNAAALGPTFGDMAGTIEVSVGFDSDSDSARDSIARAADSDSVDSGSSGKPSDDNAMPADTVAVHG